MGRIYGFDQCGIVIAAGVLAGLIAVAACFVLLFQLVATVQ